jgi:hypothetical protein
MNNKDLRDIANILREAVDILTGDKELRFPIVDEMLGLAAMLEVATDVPSDAKGENNGRS